MKGCLSLRFQEPSPDHQLGTRSVHTGRAGGEREELESEEDHRVTAVPAATQSVTSVRSQELRAWDKDTGFAASSLPSGLQQGPCAEDAAVFTFYRCLSSPGREHRHGCGWATFTVAFCSPCSPRSQPLLGWGSTFPLLIGWSACLFVSGAWQAFVVGALMDKSPVTALVDGIRWVMLPSLS